MKELRTDQIRCLKKSYPAFVIKFKQIITLESDHKISYVWKSKWNKKIQVGK
jgi:hypothetical protein